MSPWLQNTIFGVLALLAVVSSLLVVTRKNPIYSALFLIVMFSTISGIFLLLDASFLGFMQLLVYAGAIMVLYIFVIMLINPREGDLPPEGGFTDKGVAAGIALIVFSLLAFAIGKSEVLAQLASSGPFPARPLPSPTHGEIAAFGLELFQRHLLVFELASILILVGIVGAVHLTLRRKAGAALPESSEDAPDGAGETRGRELIDV